MILLAIQHEDQQETLVWNHWACFTMTTEPGLAYFLVE